MHSCPRNFVTCYFQLVKAFSLCEWCLPKIHAVLKLGFIFTTGMAY